MSTVYEKIYAVTPHRLALFLGWGETVPFGTVPVFRSGRSQ
jgi:hypothetical protein